jgi:hypothetical protein
MNKKIPSLLLGLSLLSFYGFDVGQNVELTKFLNARTNSNFLASANNIKTSLTKGTTGEVLEVKKFSSGNSGIKIKISNGPKANESYWVYYNKKDPGIMLTDIKTKKEVAIEKVEAKINKEAITKALVTREIAATRDPSEQSLIQTAIAITPIITGEVIKKSLTSKISPDCPPDVQVSTVSNEALTVLNTEKVSEELFKESDLVEPYRDVPRKFEMYPSCSNIKDNPWSTCHASGKVERFTISNGGPNKIVSTNEYYINRTFEFEFDDRARSDMKLILSDAPDDFTSHVTYSIMLFFPRSVLPSIKKVGDELHVTLPNKEIVKYNAVTKEIIGGVFSEGKMAQSANKKAIPADVKYTGKGVMIRADKSGDLPYGDIETKEGKSAPSITTATVSKAGFKDCKIPSKEIWFNDSEKKRVLIRPEFSNDEGLDNFIKKRCGFSLF